MNCRGVTLVELIIAMSLTMVIAVSVVTVYMVQARHVAQSTQFAALQRGHDNFLERFGRDVRGSNRVLAVNESFLTVVSPYTPASDSVTAVKIVNGAGGEITRYAISGDTLYRGGVPMSVGGSVVTLDGDSSWFELEVFRRECTAVLKLTAADGQQFTALPVKKDPFRCRN